MLEQYKTVYQGGTGEVVEKKSRFIATVRPVNSEEEALQFIEEMKKKYWDARHNCSAYVIGERREFMRCSDDGEPQGTAGKPMLEVLLGEDLYNTAVVVTRYFGGTLLGTGGLVRAYSKAVQEGLADSRIITKKHGILTEVGTDYNSVGKAAVSFCTKRDSHYGFHLRGRCENAGAYSCVRGRQNKKNCDRSHQRASLCHRYQRSIFCTLRWGTSSF